MHWLSISLSMFGFYYSVSSTTMYKVRQPWVRRCTCFREGLLGPPSRPCAGCNLSSTIHLPRRTGGISLQYLLNFEFINLIYTLWMFIYNSFNIFYSIWPLTLQLKQILQSGKHGESKVAFLKPSKSTWIIHMLGIILDVLIWVALYGL